MHVHHDVLKVLLSEHMFLSIPKLRRGSGELVDMLAVRLLGTQLSDISKMYIILHSMVPCQYEQNVQNNGDGDELGDRLFVIKWRALPAQ